MAAAAVDAVPVDVPSRRRHGTRDLRGYVNAALGAAYGGLKRRLGQWICQPEAPEGGRGARTLYSEFSLSFMCVRNEATRSLARNPREHTLALPIEA